MIASNAHKDSALTLLTLVRLFTYVQLYDYATSAPSRSLSSSKDQTALQRRIIDEILALEQTTLATARHTVGSIDIGEKDVDVRAHFLSSDVVLIACAVHSHNFCYAPQLYAFLE